MSTRASVRVSQFAAFSVALIGGMALLGLALDLPLFTRIAAGAGTVAMSAQTAFAFVLAGLSLVLLTREPLRPIKRNFARAAALGVALIGLVTLAENFSDWGAGIHQLLARMTYGVVAIGAPGSTPPSTALAFLFSGTALWVLHGRFWWWPAQVLASVTSLFALIALIGYAYSVNFSYGIAHSAAMAPQTAVAFVVLCVGMLAANPDRGLAGIVCSDRIGSAAARRLLPIVIGLPPVLGWLRLTGQQYGLFETEYGAALLVTSAIALSTAGVVWAVWTLNRRDDERQRVQKALQAMDARFRATFEQAAVGISHVTADGHWLRVNQKVCDIVGYSQAELQTMTFQDITHPDDLDADMICIQQLLDGAIATYAMEKRYLRKDGSIVWVNLTVSLARTPEGVADYFIGVIEDINARVAAQLQMRKLWSAIEQSAEVVTIHDRHGVIEYVNPAFEGITGYSSTEAIGRKGSLVKSGQQDHAFYHRLWETVLRGEIFRAVFVNRRKDGTHYHEEKTITPLRDGAGAITHFVATGKDITARVEAEKALLESLRYNRQLFETAAIGLALSRMDGQLVDVNPAYARILGRSVEETLQLTYLQITPIKYHQQEYLALEQLRTAGHCDTYEMEYLHRDGHLVPVRLSGVILEHNGEPCIWSSVEDVTEQKQAESRIKDLNRMYALLSDINQMLVRAHDRDELFRESCRIAVDVGGFTMAWIGIIEKEYGTVRLAAWRGAEAFFKGLQDRLDTVASGDDCILARAIAGEQPIVSHDIENDTCVALRAHLVATGSLSMAVFPILVDGEVVAVLSLHADAIGFFNEDEMNLLHELAGDISFALDHLTKVERVAYLSSFDPLTGLPNRQYLVERLAARIKTTRATDGMLAVVLLDLERFRHVNETFGWEGGDALLCAVATRLQQANASVTRLTDDRFCLMLADQESVADIVRNLEELNALCFAAPYDIAGEELRIGCRYGIAVFPDDGDSAESLLKNAEAALRRRSPAAEHYVFYTPDMNAKAAHAMALESKLRRAVEHYEFVLHYQPKVNFADGRICGVEALIRWQDPAQGLVPPLEFISVLEESGLIGEVGAWALEQAMADRRAWIDAGLVPLPVSVNVSTLQLQQRDFARHIGDLVANEGNNALEPEITESVIMEDIGSTIATLNEIRSHGVGIAIDDFGTGYSSLTYVAKLPITTLKVDREFVMAMTEGPEGWIMVSSIVALTRALKLKSVAEGVENEEQIRLLRLLGCDEGQGYFYSRPVPASDLAILLAAGDILPINRPART